MTLLRRAKYLFFTIDEIPVLDIPLLLRGRVSLELVKQVVAISLLKGEEYRVSIDEVRMLFEIPSDNWIEMLEAAERCRTDLETLLRLARQGLLVTDGDDDTDAELRERDERLSSTQWNAYAALFHYMTKWRDVNVDAHFLVDPKKWREYSASIDEVYNRFIGRYGRPPTEFHAAPNPLTTVELPLVKRGDGLFATLSRRKTTRGFDRETPLLLEHFSTILYYSFGCHGTTPVFEDIVAVKKTSPSGGGLHPTEIYPLVINVSGVNPGLYHYNVKDHALELVADLDRHQAEEWANEFTAGQTYPRRAQALFVMTTRFYRNFWKYRKHQKAYSVLLMDAAHLSQTFYLVCAELSLGAFVTGAINSVNIEEKLGLDGFTEGAILVCGCGQPSSELSIDPQFRPYVPRET